MKKDLLMNYTTIDEIPDLAQPIVKRLVASGVIGYQGEFEFSLTDETLKILMILARLDVL